MVVVKINDKILLYIFGYFGLYTFGSCIPLGLVYLWLVYLWLCIPLGDIPPKLGIGALAVRQGSFCGHSWPLKFKVPFKASAAEIL